MVTVERLDREEAEARAAVTRPVTPPNVAEPLADLQALFADAEPLTKHRILQALFEKVEMLGPNEVWLHPSIEADARGWAAAMCDEFRVDSPMLG